MRIPQLAVLMLVIALALTGAGRSPAAADSALPTPGQWPLTGRVRVVSGFSPPAQRWHTGHRGVDLAARAAAPVLAAAAGRVSFAGRLAGRGVVVVDHGQVRTTYEPVDPLVAVGDRVKAGAVIGRVGSGGHCSRRCLHWGLKEGDHYLNPLLLVGGSDDTVLRLLAADQVAVARKRTAQRAAETARAEHRVASFVSLPGEVGGFARPVPGGITSPFGMRFHPVLHVWKLHDGTDFGANCGTPIRAPAPGRVAAVSYNRAYGNRLMLDHGSVRGQQIRTGFNHATRYVVGPGTVVKRGQLLGYVGSTGYSTGCHLHLMLWVNGGLANPMTLF